MTKQVEKGDGQVTDDIHPWDSESDQTDWMFSSGPIFLLPKIVRTNGWTLLHAFAWHRVRLFTGW